MHLELQRVHERFNAPGGTAAVTAERAERLLDFGQAAFPAVFPGAWPAPTVSASPFLYPCHWRPCPSHRHS